MLFTVEIGLDILAINVNKKITLWAFFVNFEILYVE